MTVIKMTDRRKDELLEELDICQKMIKVFEKKADMLRRELEAMVREERRSSDQIRIAIFEKLSPGEGMARR